MAATTKYVQVVLILYYYLCVFGGGTTATEISNDPSSAASTEKTKNVICSPGILTNGATFPKGDISLEEGSTLVVNCTLNLGKPGMENITSKNIEFNVSRLNHTISVDQKSTRIVDNATAQFRVSNMPASRPMVTCYARKPDGKLMLICRNEVDVGYLPQEVQNFRCIAQGWKKLNCTWTKPYNPVVTDYALTQVVVQRFQYSHPCGSVNSYNGIESCEWNGRDEPHYQQNIEKIRLEMNGTNILAPSGIITTYTFDHWQIVVPEKPKTIQAKAITGREIELNWTFPYFVHFRAGLVHKITVCALNTTLPCDETEVKTNRVENFTHILQVPLPFNSYNIEVRMKSQTANDTAEFWSPPATTNVTTLTERPEFPPETTLGSFEVVHKYQTRDIYVYWKLLPTHLHNGSDFGYKFKANENGEWKDISPNKTNGSYAAFLHRSLNDHQFEIYSVNSAGVSPTSSKVYIPSTADAPKPPIEASKLVDSDGTLQISWRPNGNPVDSYTVYTCNSTRSLPNQCNELIDWMTVPGNTNQAVIRNLLHDSNYQFAVSANAKNMSSGMVFVSCEQNFDKVPGKITDISSKKMTSDSITIKWKLTCALTLTMVKKFRITYGPCEENLPHLCSGEPSEAFANSDATEFKLQNLKPFTTYKVAISIQSRSEESQLSEPLFIETLQAAPGDPPLVDNIETTNTTALIKIQPPKLLNGVVKTYSVSYKDMSSFELKTVSRNLSELQYADGSFYFLLKDLESNETYEIRARACTVHCSNFSDPFSITTKPGYTNLKETPGIVYEGGKIVVSWHRPSHIGGTIDYFEVVVKRNGELYETDEPLEVKYISDGSEYEKRVKLECDSNTNVTAQVRAVSLIDGQQLYGDWSPENVFSCFGTSLFLVWFIVAGGTFVVIVILATTWLLKKYGHMTKIPVVIPPGFEESCPTVNGTTAHRMYQLQRTSTRPDESKDFLSSNTRIKETEQIGRQVPSCPDGNENFNLNGHGHDDSYNFEDGKVPLWLWQGMKLEDSGPDDILKRNTPLTQGIVSRDPHLRNPANLSDHPRPIDSYQNIPRLSPSSSNPLLYESIRETGSEYEEEDPEHYRKLEFIGNDYGNTMQGQTLNDPCTINISIPPPNDQSANPPHVLTIDTSVALKSSHPTLGNGDIKSVPDIIHNSGPAYVKLSSLRNDPRVGAPYCQVGMLLDT